MAFSDEGIDTLRQKLGVTDAEADEATILAALDEALSEQAEPQTNNEPPPGTVVLDAAQYEALRTQAEMGVQAREQQFTDERERLVTAAIADGRIPPARKDAWLDMLKIDPGAKDVLASMKPGLVPLAALGHDQINETNEDDANYGRLFPDESKGA